MTTTPLPPHAIAVDHPNFPERHWTGFELAWIAARDKQFLAHSKQVRADLEAEVQRLRRDSEELSFLYGDVLLWTERAVDKGNANSDIEEAWSRYQEWLQARAALETRA